MSNEYLSPPSWTWAVAAATALGAAVWMGAAGVRPVVGELLLLCGGAGLLSAVGGVYATVRPAPAIASACLSAALLVLFTGAMAVVSYGGVALRAPLQDRALSGIDAALGFDWTEHLRFVAEQPWLAGVLTLAYESCQAQLIVVICGLALCDRAALREFMGLYILTAVAVVVVSSLAPSIGAYAHHAPPPSLVAALPDPEAGRWHLEHFNQLREGSFATFSWRSAEGLISFPSFHTALGVIFARAFFNVPYLGVPGLALNGLMILSTLAIGGHYLVDVLVGAAIAFAASMSRNVRRACVFGLRCR